MFAGCRFSVPESFSGLIMQLSKRFFNFSILFLFANAKSFFELNKCPYSPTEHSTSSFKIGLVNDLIFNCNYDKLHPPPTNADEPLIVHIKIYFYFLRYYEAHDLQFTSYMLVQQRYVDSRLRFDPDLFNVTEIIGTKELSRLIWLPHLYITDEKKSEIMGAEENDIMIHIHYDGTVLYTKRVESQLFCWMKLQKFPFDSHNCTLTMESWSYIPRLNLNWEDVNPVLYKKTLSTSEFRVVGDPVPTQVTYNFNLRDHASQPSITFHLQRESGFYIYDYFIPSFFLVVVSWVSFWLEPEAPVVSGRTVLGCSTMLSFIILAHHTGNSLPKVSYIKASEIWFLGCTAFIFGSLVEFAFVNIIYRSRRKEIGFKKINSKYILKEMFVSKRKRFHTSEGEASQCPPALNRFISDWENWKGIDAFKTVRKDPDDCSSYDVSNTDKYSKPDRKKEGWRTTMTPQEISNWIDRKCRIGFPISFLLFNIAYWSFVHYM